MGTMTVQRTTLAIEAHSPAGMPIDTGSIKEALGHIVRRDADPGTHLPNDDYREIMVDVDRRALKKVRVLVVIPLDSTEMPSQRLIACIKDGLHGTQPRLSIVQIGYDQ